MAQHILVGTTKGAFILDAPDWPVRGPFCEGSNINHVIGDGHSIWAAGGGGWNPVGIWRSDDGGATWAVSGQGLDPDLVNIWSLGQSNGTLYAGTKPAALYASQDRGDTWQHVQGLSDHPSRPDWQPGNAGLILHSIVADHARLWVGISAVGTFASDDGGATWDHRARLTNSAAHDHGDDHDVGICVHNIVRAGGDLLYQQNHHGVFRSLDGGHNWTDITAGLPSTFGFPIGVNPGDPQMIWTFPLNGDSQGRFPPDGKAAVWRSTDGGATWEDQRNGLPQTAFFTVLRQGMATDAQGVYFGTNTGSVFASTDAGESWLEVAKHLPCVLSVEVI
jgi:hypothetical protein